MTTHITVFLTNTKQEVMEVVIARERRRRWLAEGKMAIVRESFELGKTASTVARQDCSNPNQWFGCRKLYQNDSLFAISSEEAVVPASELSDALAKVHKLQRLQGKKTTENDILQEAVDVMKSRKWIARSSSLPQDEQ